MRDTRFPLTYGPTRIRLRTQTRFPAELVKDAAGDYGLNCGYYGVNPPTGGWSVETGYDRLGKDMGYWSRVCENAELIDRWMAENFPTRNVRIGVRFRDGEVVIFHYDWADEDDPWVVLPAADAGN